MPATVATSLPSVDKWVKTSAVQIGKPPCLTRCQGTLDVSGAATEIQIHPPHRLSGLRWRASTWWTILRTALEERLVYRGDFALGTLMRFLPIITQIFLWYAIFDSIGAIEGEQAVRIGGFGFREMVAYYLADDGRASVFEHAGTGSGNRPADSRW